MDFVKVLKVDCNLATLDIQDKIFLIFEIISLAVKNRDCQIKITIYYHLVSIGAKNVDML